MLVLYPRGCGVDIHQKRVVACVLLTDPDGADGTPQRCVRPCGTMTADLVALGDWLEFPAVTHVAMERTGVRWRPVFTVLGRGARSSWSTCNTSKPCRAARRMARTGQRMVG